jgi:transposase
MTRKVTSVSIKVLAAAVASGAAGEVNISRACAEAGVSRKTSYKWVGRFDPTDPASLLERSRRPLSSPNQTPPAVEEVVVRLRKELADAGLDHGATTIVWHLGRDPEFVYRVPSRSTVHTILVRRGLVVPEPRKRPKSSIRRFEAPRPNEWWQIDSMDWVIATGMRVQHRRRSLEGGDPVPGGPGSHQR